MADQTIRFCAGSQKKQYSSVWPLWAHRNDVYLGTRTILGVFKLSLHESGQWITAFTNQSGATFEDTGLRRHFKWIRPEEFAPGWTLGPTILLPWVRWVEQPRHREDLPRKLEWIPGPRKRGKLMINILFAAPEVELDKVDTVSLPGDSIIGNIKLKNGETVWLQARWRPMLREETDSIETHAQEFEGFRTETPYEQMSAWTTWVHTGEETPILIQIPLGRHHFGK